MEGVVFACSVALIAFLGFSLSIVGSQAGFKDWGFHSCYARSLDAAGCSNGAYDSYAWLVHAPAYALNALGVPPELFFAVFVAVCLVFLAVALFDAAGIVGFLSFFWVAPFASVYLLGNNSFLWFSWGLCGNIAWVGAFTVFAWLILAWRDLSAWLRLLGFAVLFAVHNYGWGLAALAFGVTFGHTFGGKWLPESLNLYSLTALAIVLSTVFAPPLVAARLYTPFLLFACAGLGVSFGQGSRE